MKLSLVRGSPPAARLIALPLAVALSACLYAENKPQENIRPAGYTSRFAKRMIEDFRSFSALAQMAAGSSSPL